jgi:hypothetical protein
MHMQRNKKSTKNPAMASLDRRVVISTAGTSLLAMLAIYSLMRTGKLTAFAKQATWWIQNAFFTYQNSLVNNPLSTKVGTGAFLAILGDALAQSTTGEGAPYDRRRALSFAVFDSCYRVFQHKMFPAVIALCQGHVLSKVLPMVIPTVGAAIERTLFYQLVVVPVSETILHNMWKPKSHISSNHIHYLFPSSCSASIILLSLLSRGPFRDLVPSNL